MKFKLSEKFVVDSDVEPWRREGLRIVVLGGPGSGKSWNNSLLAEQFLLQGGTVIIFQPRDEFFTLKEKFDIVCVGGVHVKDMEFVLTSPSIYAKAVVEDGISMIFYTSGLDEEKLVDWVSRFIEHTLTLQEKHKRPLLLILEEAHEYAPRSPSGHIARPWIYNRMVKSVKDVFTQGRKLNIVGVASSQRPPELNFTVRQLANLTFYGRFSDQDIGYIDKECLKYVRMQGIDIDASNLLNLGLGEWLVIMGKESRFIKVTHPRFTHHGAETPRLEYIAPRTEKTKASLTQLTDAVRKALEAEEREKSETEKLKRQMSNLQKELADKDKKLDQMEAALKVATSLQLDVKQSGSMEEVVMLSNEVKKLREEKAVLLKKLCKKVIKVFDEFSEKPQGKEETIDDSVSRMLLEKLPTKASKTVLEFLLKHRGIKFTKPQIALQTGYRNTAGGTFGTAFKILKDNNLVKTDGKMWWVE
ncbi:MAG: DUF87 domain-containing protein [Candidatus Bathyarchaeota archaeon]|nr:DUF87 domain-containing protein [Candidatus Bathyarchaeota archaeon]